MLSQFRTLGVLLLVTASGLYLWNLRPEAFDPPAPVAQQDDAIKSSPAPVSLDRGSGPLASKPPAVLATNGPASTFDTGPDSYPSYTDKPKLHVVVAHYDEEPHWIGTWLDDLRQVNYVQELGLYITIYTKGPASKIDLIRTATGADAVINLPNAGREGGSYLHHMLENYDDPPPFALYTQSYLKKAQRIESGPGEGHLEEWLLKRLRSKFDEQTGFMSLDRKHDICYCGHCTDMGHGDFYPLWPQLYALITGEVCQHHEGQILSFNGHFIVSRKRILEQPRHMYEYLKELVDAPDDHWIHTEPDPKWFEKDKGKSVVSNPKFGHTLERLWHTLFACDRPEQVTDCDVSGMKAEGPGGCTCKD